MMTEERFYFRCLDCLAIAVISGREAAQPVMDLEVVCGCGSTAWDFMGRVRGHLLERIEEQVACDERCVSAPGPQCSCRCGAINHGSGITVEVTKTCGIPTITPLDKEAIERGQNFRKERDKAYAALTARWPQTGKWLPRAEWEERREAWRRFHHAEHSKIHRARMAELSELSERYTTMVAQ